MSLDQLTTIDAIKGIFAQTTIVIRELQHDGDGKE